MQPQFPARQQLPLLIAVSLRFHVTVVGPHDCLAATCLRDEFRFDAAVDNFSLAALRNAVVAIGLTESVGM